MAAMLGRIVNDYSGLVEICRQRAAELEVSQSDLDSRSGLPDGYSGKLLGEKQKKKLGHLSLGLMLGSLGLRMLIIEDDVSTARTLASRKPVVKTQQRFGNKCNSPKLLTVAQKNPENEKPPKSTSRAHLRVIQTKRRGSSRGSKYG